MATGPPPSVNAPQQESSPPPQISWDGDRMFNIYIYDYCMKRGYQKTARELLAEAELSPDSQPPINAKQGLLFEWWSVFWVLFTAKSNGNGTEDAMMYTQHQANQSRPVRMGNQVAAQNRFINGVRTGPPPGPHMPNGIPTTNGPPTGQPTMANGTQALAPFPGGAPQPNGVPGPAPPNPANAPGANTPAQQPQLLPNQRFQQQQRLNGTGPFQSPTMAPALQTPGGTGHPGTQGNQPGAGTPIINHSQPLTQMNRGGMLPPNGPHGAPGNVPIRAGQTPQTGFQQLASSASQPSSPATNSVTAPSPSLAARQPPSGDPMRQIQESSINQDVFRIPASLVTQLKQEVGLGNKDILSLNFEEKQRLVTIARQRGVIDSKVGPPGPPHPAAGPSGMNQAMQPQQRPPQVGQLQHAHPGQQQTGQQNQARVMKRSSDSPPEVNAQIPSQNDSSPPKKFKAEGSEGAPPMTPMMPFPHPSQPGGPGAPQQIPAGMMGRPMGGVMSGFPGQMPNANQMMHMNGPPMPGMPPAMAHSPGMMGGPIHQYRQSMHQAHQNKLPHGALGQGLMSANGSSPGSANDQFGGGDGNQSRPGTGQFGGGGPGVLARGVPNKPLGMMHPSNSPGVNAAKNAGKDGVPSPAQAHASPRNPAMNVGQAQNSQAPPGNTAHGNNTAPPTPVPAPNTTNITPSPSAILNGTATPAANQQMQSSNTPAADPLNFGTDFMDLSGFDGGLFDGSGVDVGFEMSGGFGDWFAPEASFPGDK